MFKKNYIISFALFLIVSCPFTSYAQSNKNTQSVKLEKITRSVRQLTAHQDLIRKKKTKKRGINNENQNEKEKKPYNIIETNQRLTREKPQDGNYEKLQLIDLTNRKVNRLKRKLTTNQEEGKTVYVKKEVITKINRLQQESIANVNIADSGVVSLAVAEDKLKDDEVTVKKDGDTTDNTLATFAVASQNTSANHLYRITKDGDYQYQDGKDIVGSAKFSEWFKKGYKPITERTFYYEIAEQPHINLKQKNVSSFTSMSIAEQVVLIKKSIAKSSEYVDLDELTRSKTGVLGTEKSN